MMKIKDQMNFPSLIPLKEMDCVFSLLFMQIDIELIEVQYQEISSQYALVYEIPYENLYSVVLLNCYPTSATIGVCIVILRSIQGSIQIQSYYNGMLVNITLEKQPESVIWPIVAVVYMIVLFVFIIIVVSLFFHYQQNSKAKYRGTSHIRHVDIVLELLVIVRLIAALFHTFVVWYTLQNSTTNFSILFLDSFASQLIEVCLLETIFLLGCGWQINHQLLTVVHRTGMLYIEEGKTNWYVYVCWTDFSYFSLFLL